MMTHDLTPWRWPSGTPLAKTKGGNEERRRQGDERAERIAEMAASAAENAAAAARMLAGRPSPRESAPAAGVSVDEIEVKGGEEMVEDLERKSAEARPTPAVGSALIARDRGKRSASRPAGICRGHSPAGLGT